MDNWGFLKNKETLYMIMRLSLIKDKYLILNKARNIIKLKF